MHATLSLRAKLIKCFFEFSTKQADKKRCLGELTAQLLPTPFLKPSHQLCQVDGYSTNARLCEYPRVLLKMHRLFPATQSTQLPMPLL